MCGRSLEPTLHYSSGNLSLAIPLHGHYLIEYKVNQTEMSIIYQGVDRSAANRVVAIREMNTPAIDPQGIELFKQEVEILGNLNHPNLPKLFDSFEENGRYYMVMEFLSGRSLLNILNVEHGHVGISENRVLIWVEQLCDVLSYLHNQKPHIIYRDVKPNNIMELQGTTQIKLIDFGIARFYRPGQRKDTVTFGTPGYAPPEQYGKGQTDERSDIYGLGATLHHLLTGRDPTESPFSFPPAHEINPLISVQVSQAIARAVSIKPSDRFASMAEMKAALVGKEPFIGAIANYPNWPEWEQTIQTSLMEFGQIKASDLASIPQNLRASAIKRYIELYPDQDVGYSPDFQELCLNRFQEWQEIREHWYKAKQMTRESGFAAKTAIEQMIRKVISIDSKDAVDEVTAKVQILLFGRQIEKQAHFGRLSIYYGNVEPILSDLRISSTLPLVVFRGTTLAESDLTKLQTILDPKIKGASRIALLLLFSDERDLQQAKDLLNAKMKQVYAYDIITLAYHELFQVATAKEPQRIFRSMILSQVDLVAISPFVITGPTADHNFFGREQEMQTIVEQAASASFTIIGGRRFGKSSLLRRLYKVRLPAAGFLTIYQDSLVITSFDAFISAKIREWQPSPPSNAPKTFGDLLQDPPSDKPLVLLLDEADRLVHLDKANGWQLFNTLRAFAHSGQGQVVLGGERLLREALQDSNSPLFNFVNEIILDTLEFRAVEELITRSMRQLEIELEDEAQIVQQIWGFTSGHPNIVQRLCHRLIERLNIQGTRRVTSRMVDAVVSSPEFQEKDFLQTYWERTTPLERIISLVLAQDPRIYRFRDILNLLASENLEIKPEVVKEALDRLVYLRRILKRSQVGYEFAVTAFPLVVSNTTTAEDLLIVLKSKYQQNPLEIPEWNP